MEKVIVNKVAESGLLTLDLSAYLPNESQMASFDLKPFLFMELVLREKEFREQLKGHDWSVYAGKQVAVFCSADAIIPVWAYMLVASYLSEVAAGVHLLTPEALVEKLLLERISAIDIGEFSGKRVVVKGCGDVHIPESAYLAVTARLRPVVKSIMYGEPCSTVPIYKQRPA
jgi:hypothetical protein